MATLGAMTGLTVVSMGGSEAKKTQGPPINAQSPDEESFIKYVHTWEETRDPTLESESCGPISDLT